MGSDGPYRQEAAHRADLHRGTIEKTYDELGGVLSNAVSVLEVMLSRLVLEGVHIDRVSLMNKDSLEMTPEDHELIAKTALHCADDFDGVIIVHGTDRLAGERTADLRAQPRAPRRPSC